MKNVLFERKTIRIKLPLKERNFTFTSASLKNNCLFASKNCDEEGGTEKRQQVIPVYTEVFQHFEKKFKDVMKNLNMDSDVKKLRDRIEQKKAECLENENIAKTNDKILIPSYQPIPIKSYKLKNNHSADCLLFAMPESSLTECLRNREKGGKCP